LIKKNWWKFSALTVLGELEEIYNKNCPLA
jgi:hypothetical protein